MSNTNFGKASVTVNLVPLKGVSLDRNIFDFDIHASVFNALSTLGTAFPPFFLESLTDETKGFSTFFPSKRKYPVDNLISGSGISQSSNSDKPQILWTPTTVTSTLVKEIIDKQKFDSYDLKSKAKNYEGPEWKSLPCSGEPLPTDGDEALISKWIAVARGGAVSTSPVTPPVAKTNNATAIPSTYYVNQGRTKDGLWWGLESNEFLNENTPFWITIDKDESPPSLNHDTFLVVSLGIDDSDNAFDLYLSSNRKPIMVDYSGTAGNSLPKEKIQEFSDELSRIWATDKHIQIGFMTVAGKLAIWVNKLSLLYTRVSTGDKSGSKNATSGQATEIKIAKGKIRLYGSNCQMNINVSPMTFMPMGICALPLPVIPKQADGDTITPQWAGVDYKLDPSGDVAKMPQEPSSKNPVYGVDCANFHSMSGGSTPSGFACHKEGDIYFKPATELGISGANASDYYVLYMVPSHVTLPIGTIKYSGCPYFFRLKGRYAMAPTGKGKGGGGDISEDVISISEQWQLDDYSSISGTASVVLYNSNGKYDDLKTNQTGIEISFGWNGFNEKTFQGIVTGVTSSETAGKEELTLTCSDYMFILKNTQMFNSPYYDGMLMFYAAKDIVMRAGIDEVINDWTEENEYYLPAGYSFTKPAVKFDDNQMLYDCIKSLVERAEAYFYFDIDGKCHIAKLPGGLFSDSGGSNTNVFSRNPESPNAIIDAKNVEYDYSDTVNRITVYSLDRNTRDAILYTKSDTASKIIYRRVGYFQEASLGRLSAVVKFVDELAKRVFYPIRKTSFKTVGSTKAILPLQMATVDGQPYRIIGMSRKYDASNNDYITEFNCEWLGGK